MKSCGTTTNREPGSFRDPNGYVFYREGEVFRYISRSGLNDLNLLISSGLYENLVHAGKLIEFEKCGNADIENGIFVRAEKIEFISYPYQWCFNLYKDAALLTLDIMKAALRYDMWLKDASAYNIQHNNGRLVLIDILSFEKYPEGKPWIAYRQFCQHFLVPLLLMAKVDIRMNNLMQLYLDGIPLDLAVKLLPFKTMFSPLYAIHIYLHARYQKKYEKHTCGSKLRKSKLSRKGLENMLNSLISAVSVLKIKNVMTEWSDYYTSTNYSDIAFSEKKMIISKFLDKISPKRVCDMGANNGEFSRLEELQFTSIIACDVDSMAVDKNYCHNRSKNIKNVLPLQLDITNPSPAIGWMNEERHSFLEQCEFDLILALALIHHLVIANNVPLKSCASFFAPITEYLIIEFIPKADSQVQILLKSRKDIFTDYTESAFESSFKEYFNIINKRMIQNSTRSIYLMKKKKIRS